MAAMLTSFDSCVDEDTTIWLICSDTPLCVSANCSGSVYDVATKRKIRPDLLALAVGILGRADDADLREQSC